MKNLFQEEIARLMVQIQAVPALPQAEVSRLAADQQRRAA
jgi:uncharacterized small protein (DUF1192 family)